MLADDILALLRRRPMTIEEVAKELKRTESEVLIPLYGELKGLVQMERGGKWKRKNPSDSVG
jgi:predicted transcriptional regulator